MKKTFHGEHGLYVIRALIAMPFINAAILMLWIVVSIGWGFKDADNLIRSMDINDK